MAPSKSTRALKKVEERAIFLNVSSAKHCLDVPSGDMKQTCFSGNLSRVIASSVDGQIGHLAISSSESSSELEVRTCDGRISLIFRLLRGCSSSSLELSSGDAIWSLSMSKALVLAVSYTHLTLPTKA